MNLFSVGKVGFMLESIAHKTEKRREGEEKVIVLGCRVTPFSHQLAEALDDVVRGSLYARNGNADPREHVRTLEFTLPIGRQDIDIFASPDTEKATRRIEQVKVSHMKAKIAKGAKMFDLKVKLTFGPASDKELAYVESWRGTQRFLSFSESAPDLAFEDLDARDDEEETNDAQPGLPVEGEEAKTDRAQHRALSHTNKKRKRR